MFFDLILGLAVPGFLVFFMMRKYHVKFKAILTGAAVFLIFAMVLEQLVHKVVLGSAALQPYMAKLAVYAIYGGLMAGLFEETGKFIAMKTVLKRDQGDNRNALAYGVGHGGIEMIFLLSIGMINNIAYSFLINSGNIDTVTSVLPADQLTKFQAVIDQLTSSSPWLFLVSPLERLFAITSQIAMSVIVWYAAKRGGKAFWFLPLAILLHAMLDGVAYVINQQFGIVAAECCIFAMTVAISSIAVLLWRKMKIQDAPHN